MIGKRFFLAIALLTTLLGIAGAVRGFAISPTPRPVAIMHQSQIGPIQGTAKAAVTPETQPHGSEVVSTAGPANDNDAGKGKRIGEGIGAIAQQPRMG